ncbi:MAG: minor capsid protein [Clostridia bacterium]
MRFTVSEVKIDLPAHLAKINSPAFWTFAAVQWHRLYAPYVPFETGTLEDTVTITAKEIVHTAPYAAYQYGGRFSHNLALHPLASRAWDRAAAPTQKTKLVAAMQGYVDAGRLGLDD